MHSQQARWSSKRNSKTINWSWTTSKKLNSGGSSSYGVARVRHDAVCSEDIDHLFTS